MAQKKVSLGKVCQVMMDLAPLRYAGEWDNVGLLLEPGKKIKLDRVLLTIDLTEAVMDEAVAMEAGLIIAYHPPLFVPIKRLTQSDAKSRIVLNAAQAGLPIYSPHTALDNVEGGVNDWLADGLGSGTREVLQLEPDQPGSGRLVKLDEPASLEEIAKRIRAHLNLNHIRCAPAERHRGEDAAAISTIALCAGAGATVIGVSNAQLYYTGEMRHHDVLRANEAGSSVILCEHTNTERGYLPVLKKNLQAELPGVEFTISNADREPLTIV
jgi:dinuclear metal center YbgI/SA1388 family protein